MIVSAAYGVLAAITAISLWKRPSLRSLGLALALGYIGSNVAHAMLAPVERPPLYTVIEIVVALMAYGSHLEKPARLMIAIIYIAGISILSNVVYSGTEQGHDETVVWQWITNLCFAGECLLAICAGVKAGGGIGGWLPFRHGAAPLRPAHKGDETDRRS